MKSAGRSFFLWFLISMLALSLRAQQGTPSAAPTTVVPHLVNFSGKAVDAQGKTLSGISGVTFAIYKDQYEGAPLWMEMQNVQVDAAGNYTAQLGASKPMGLPLDLFTSGEARWLGVRLNGGDEQPRVLLLSVPYALKAADAETLGGVPLSAFVLAAPANGNGNGAPTASAPPVSAAAPSPNAAVTGAGTVNAIPLWDTASDIVSSVMTQTGSGTTARIGINTATPSSTLDVKGTSTFRGSVGLPPTGAATSAAGKTSQPVNLIASAFNSVTGAAVNQTFRLQSEPVGNNTSTASGTLNLLYAAGANAATETGLRIASNGRITFAAGQTFPGTGKVTSVGLSAPSPDFTVSGSPVITSGTLGLNWKVTPTNANTANAIVKRDASGGFSTGSISATQLTASGVITASNVTTSNPTGVGIWGQSSGTNGGSDGVHGVTSSPSASGVAGVNTGNGGVGVWGDAATGFGFYTPNNVQQARAAGGWVKAMVLGSGGNYGFPPGIVSCFNSTLAGAAATTTPCGFTFDKTGIGDYIVNFGFQVSDRFFSVTTHVANPSTGVCTSFTGYCLHSLSVNEAEVTLWVTAVQEYTDSNFYLIVY
jgi:hypothetical protein